MIKKKKKLNDLKKALYFRPKKSSFRFPQRHLGLLLGRKLHWMNYKPYPKDSYK